jgi:hypothetical protein
MMVVTLVCDRRGCPCYGRQSAPLYYDQDEQVDFLELLTAAAAVGYAVDAYVDH